MRARLHMVRRGLVNAFLTFKPTNQSFTKNEFLSLYFSLFECTKWINKVGNNFVSFTSASWERSRYYFKRVTLYAVFVPHYSSKSLVVSQFIQSMFTKPWRGLSKWCCITEMDVSLTCVAFQSLFNEPLLHCLKCGSIKNQIILRIWSMCVVLTSYGYIDFPSKRRQIFLEN